MPVACNQTEHAKPDNQVGVPAGIGLRSGLPVGIAGHRGAAVVPLVVLDIAASVIVGVVPRLVEWVGEQFGYRGVAAKSSGSGGHDDPRVNPARGVEESSRLVHIRAFG